MLKRNLISIVIALVISMPIAILAWKEQCKPEFVDINEPLVTETYTEYVPIYPVLEENETVLTQNESPIVEVAPVQPEYPIYDFIPLSAELQEYICEVSARYELNPLPVYAIMWRESGFKTDALRVTDKEHSVGMMQVNILWHKDRMDKLGVTDIYDPYQNIKVGIDYFVELLAWREDTTLEWAFMAYNGGPTYADEMAAKGQLSEYAISVMDKLMEYSYKEDALYGY